ncbi:MAG TPA: hypothetical protein VLQ93_05175, partial [Myxococcaceae bacterium]|nr:hypothetical protein [Myxococcaceae bacterium]
RLALDAPLSTAHVLSDGRVLIHDPRLRNVVAWEPSTGKSGAALLGAGFDAVRFSDALGAAVFRHPSTPAGGAALTVARLHEEASGLRVRLQPIAVSRPVRADALDETRGRLYFAPEGLPVLVRLDLETLSLEQLTLDAPITALHYLPARDVLAAVHGSPAPEGDITLIPASQLERGAAERVRLFVFADALDHAEQRP